MGFIILGHNPAWSPPSSNFSGVANLGFAGNAVLGAFGRLVGSSSTGFAATGVFSGAGIGDVADFDARVAALGADHVLSTDFPDISHKEAHQHKTIAFGQEVYETLIYDTSVYRSGGGSLRFTATHNEQNDWRINMGETPGSTVGTPAGTDQQFGLKGLARDLGDVACIQFRWRGDLTLLDTVFSDLTGRGGWKVAIFSEGDTDSTPSSDSGVGASTLQEVVINDANLDGVPYVYTSNLGRGVVDGANTTGESWTDSEGRLHLGQSWDEHLHNQVATGNANAYLDKPLRTGMSDFNGDGTFGSSTGAYQLTYSGLPSEYLSNFPASFYHPAEWMTLQLRVTFGPLGTAASSLGGTFSGWTDSRIEFWMAREGQPSTKLIDKSGVTIERGDGASNTRAGQGKLWFTKFHTGLNAKETPDGYFWIDELIVGKSIVIDPATGSAPPGSLSAGALTGSATLDFAAGSTIANSGPPPDLNGSSSLGFAVSAAIHDAAASSVLSDAVAGMAVNGWLLFEDTWPGGDNAFWQTAGAGTTEGLLDFVHTGAHDPVTGYIMLVGAGYGPAGFVVYDVDADTWSMTEQSNDIIHGWDHFAYDNTRGIVYYGSHGGGSQFSTDPVSKSLTSGLSAPWGNFHDTYGMEYFPELDSVIWYDGSNTGNIYRRPHGGSAAVYDTSQSAQGGFNHFATYNPVKGSMYFGGGTASLTLLRELDDLGSITLPTNTGNPGIECTRQHALCGDVTGDLVVIDNTNGQVHAHQDGSGWSLVDSSMPSALQTSSPITCAIPLRGFAGKEIFMVFNAKSSNPTDVVCYLYRYS